MLLVFVVAAAWEGDRPLYGYSEYWTLITCETPNAGQMRCRYLKVLV